MTSYRTSASGVCYDSYVISQYLVDYSKLESLG